MKLNKKPIAVIGMAFRFPGDLDTSQDFWQSLLDKKSQISEMNSKRWPQEQYYHPNPSMPGCSYVNKAGLLSSPFSFDAPFFNVSPREAEQMDPQQRLLLELTWHAMEDSRQLPKHYAKQKTGVYIGVGAPDYGVASFITDVGAVDSQTMLGNTNSIVSNRLSYFFNLNGPSLSIDTACSSSLVALHEACLSLLSGESRCAIVGGCNLICHPFPFVGFSKAQMLSPDGECRAFDAGANGYVRSEGAAVLILKPLKDAIRDRDNIQALILNTGVNSDGQTSSLPVPSMKAQQALIEEVCNELKFDVNDLDYFEAHGTGTLVGDPIEATAIGNAIGKKRKSSLVIGSVKPNLGHLECGSGVAGLIKLIHCLKERTIPANINFKKENPNIDFEELNLKLTTDSIVLNKSKPLVMGINSFGFGGTNAHALLQEYYPPQKENHKIVRNLPPLRVSANSNDALKKLFRSYYKLIEGNPDNYYNIAWSSFFTRAHLKYGRIFRANSIESQLKLLQEAGNAKKTKHYMRFNSLKKITLVYSGNGCQWEKMAQDLLKSNCPTAKRTINKLEKGFIKIAGFSIKEILNSNDSNRYSNTEQAQPALFALQVILTEVLITNGITIDCVVGHSVGEVTAAWASNALSLEEAIKVIHIRSLTQGKTKGLGKMAAVNLSRSQAEKVIKELNVDKIVSIAAENSVQSVTISGLESGLAKIENYCSLNEVFYKQLDLDYAFHSNQMDGIKGELINKLQEVKPKETKATLISTVTGAAIKGSELSAQYWWKNIRQPVLFKQAIEFIVSENNCTLIEIGPNPILQSYIKESSKDKNCLILPSLIKEKDEIELLNSLIETIHLSGVSVNLAKWFLKKGTSVSLPNYPFDKQEYRIKPTSRALGTLDSSDLRPLVGEKVKAIGDEWKTNLSIESEPYLKGHVVEGMVVLPGSAYVNQMLSVQLEVEYSDLIELNNFEIYSPIILSNDYFTKVHMQFNSNEITIQSKRDSENDELWQINAKGTVKPSLESLNKETNLEHFIKNADYSIDSDEHYYIADKLGLSYKHDFRSIDKMWCLNNKILSKFDTKSFNLDRLEKHSIYPPTLDLSFQSILGLYKKKEYGHLAPQLLVPVKIDKMLIAHKKKNICYSLLSLEKTTKRSALVSIDLINDTGEVVATLENVRLKSIPKIKVDKSLKRYVYQQKIIQNTKTNQPFINIEQLEKLSLDTQKSVNSFFERIKDQHIKQILCLEYLISSSILSKVKNELKNNVATFEHLADLMNVHQSKRSHFFYCLQLLKKNKLIEQKSSSIVVTEQANELNFEELWVSLLADGLLSLYELLWVAKTSSNLKSNWKSLEINEPELDSNKNYLSTDGFYNHSLLSKRSDYLLEEGLNSLFSLWPKNKTKKVLWLCQYKSMLPEVIKNNLDDLELHIITTNDCTYGMLRNEIKNVSNVSIQKHPNNKSLDLKNYFFDLVVVNDLITSFDNPTVLLKSIHECCTTESVILFLDHENHVFENYCLGVSPCWWLNDGNRSSTRRSSANGLRTLLTNHNFVVSPSIQLSPHSSAYLIYAQSLALFNKKKEEIETYLLISDHIENFINTVDKSRSVISFSFNDTYQLSESKLVQMKEILKKGEIRKTVIYLRDNISDGADVTKKFYNLVKSMHALSQVHTEEQLILNIVYEGNDLFFYGIQAMMRVARNECSSVFLRLIRLKDKSPETMRVLWEQIGSSFCDDEITISIDGCYGNRFIEKKLSTDVPKDIMLDFEHAGSLNNLEWVSKSLSVLKKNEVRINVKSVGLNFRDVMYVMGLISDEALENGFLGASLGMEFSGTIVDKGSEVKELQVGERVFGFSASSFSNSLTVEQSMLATIPDEWSFEQAATVPVAFFTAFYALKHQAQLLEGETVLIHGAAGGVGIAAIQVAMFLGAEVIATVGNEEKELFVKHLGIENVFSSRDLSFEHQIKNKFKGVDVVLNCLAGEAIESSLKLLSPFGRFIELGKRDFYTNSKIGLRPFRNNLSYFGIDVDQLIKCQPKKAAIVFKELLDCFNNKYFMPLPYIVFPSDKIIEAFRYMQQSRQIGKVVVNLKVEQDCEQKSFHSKKLKDNKYYLVTGGLKGFGLKCAEHLTSLGAKKLILLSKTGALDNDSRGSLATLKDRGVAIVALSCDVTDYQLLEQKLTPYLSSISGIIHAANTYHDALISTIDEEQFQKGFETKAIGGINLSKLTEKRDLDFFILVGSISTFIGNVGQVNYVTANGILEGIACERQSMGLPAKVISLGPIDNVGILKRHSQTKDSLNESGVYAKHSQDYLDVFDQLIGSDYQNECLCSLNFSSLSQSLSTLDCTRFSNVSHYFELTSSSSGETFLKQLENLTFDESHQLLTKLLSEEVINILKLPVESLDYSQPFTELGLDSIMGVELVHVLEKKLKVKVPVMILTQALNVNDLATKLISYFSDNKSTKQIDLDKHFNTLETKHITTLNPEQRNQIIDEVANQVTESYS